MNLIINKYKYDQIESQESACGYQTESLWSVEVSGTICRIVMTQYDDKFSNV